jgi:outer membrane lipoprotein-sorting protein
MIGAACGGLRAIALTALLLPGAAAAQARSGDGLTAVQQRVAQVSVLRGEFTQEKRIEGFKNPLRSQGRFVLSRDKGVVWTTLKPFPSEVVLTRDRILSRQRDGSTRVELDARQQPALRAVNEMMFALMSGDVKALTGRFDAQPQLLPNNGWKLTLKPKPGAVAQAFTAITLEGDRYVRRVGIDERNGDRTQLQFSGMTEAPAKLTADEVQRFD